MATYIHNNFKNALAYKMSCGAGATTRTATDTNVLGTTSAYYESPFGPYLYLAPKSQYSSQNVLYAYLSSSDAVLTNENTCPDLIDTFTVSGYEYGVTTFGIGNTNHTWSIRNTDSNPITVRKIAVYHCKSNNQQVETGNSFYLLYVVDLAEPVTIGAGEEAPISFTFDVTNI